MPAYPVSPLAPERFPDLPPVPGVRLAAAATGMRYKGRTDLMLMELAPGSTIAGVFTRSLTAAPPVESSDPDPLGFGEVANETPPTAAPGEPAATGAGASFFGPFAAAPPASANSQAGAAAAGFASGKGQHPQTLRRHLRHGGVHGFGVKRVE